MKNLPLYIIAACIGTSLCFIGCPCEPVVTPKLAVKPVVETETVTQACDGCGATYHTFAFDGKEIQPTMDWCFECGRFCQEGFELLVAIQKLSVEEIQDGAMHAEMMEHCKTCFGCKAALFRDKAEWEAKLAEYEEEKAELKRWQDMPEKDVRVLAGREPVAVMGLSGVAIESRERWRSERAKEELKRREAVPE